MPTIQTFRTFVFLAPPIGWLVYATGMVIGEAVQGDSLASLGTGVLVILIGAPFSYLFGIVPALVVALMMVTGSAAFEVEAGLVFAMVVGSLGGVLFAFLFHREADAAVLGVPVYFGLKVLTFLVPTLICWWLICGGRVLRNDDG